MYMFIEGELEKGYNGKVLECSGLVFGLGGGRKQRIQ
jgi:hypothetical protein